MNVRGWLLFLILASVVAPWSQAAASRTSPGQAGDFGVGAVFGSPMGLSSKYWLSDDRALEGQLAWKPGDDDRLEMSLDHLWHHAFFTNPSIDGRLPFYGGLGLRVLAGDDSEAGIRFPLGVSFLCKDAPVEFFAEIAPVMRFAPDLGGDVDGGIGVRYYFIPHF